MEEEDLDRDQDASEPSLLQLAEEYLSNELDEDTAANFEKRLAHDADAREALIQALTIRGLVDLAFERMEEAHEGDNASDDDQDSGGEGVEEEGASDEIGPPARKNAAACRSTRVLMPAYRRGTLDAKNVAELSRHLETCPACTAWYEAFDMAVPLRKRATSWARAAAIFIIGGAVFGPVGWWLAPGGEGSAAIGAPAGLIWPAVPFPVEDMNQVCAVVVDRGGASDEDPLAALVAKMRADNPGCIEAMAAHPLIAEAIRALPTLGSDLARRDEIVLLILYFNDSRFLAKDRKEVLEPLCDRIPGDGGRAFLTHVVEGATELPILKEALQLIHMKGWRDGDARILALIEQRALRSADPELVEFLLFGLSVVEPARGRTVAMDVLRGAFGEFTGTMFPQAAQQLVAACDRLAVPDRTRDLRLILEDPASPSPGCMQACRKLWMDTQDARWRQRLLEFAENGDWRARLGVPSLSAGEYAEDDLPVIEKLAEDPEVRVANRARSLLKELKKPQD